MNASTVNSWFVEIVVCQYCQQAAYCCLEWNTYPLTPGGRYSAINKQSTELFIYRTCAKVLRESPAYRKRNSWWIEEM